MADKPSAPAFTMGGSRKSDLVLNKGLPGPGAYEKPSSIKVQQSMTKVSKSKRFDKYETLAPGPGTYTQENKSHIPSAMILSRSKQKKMQEKPGPGAYEPDFSKLVKSQSSYKLGGAPRLPDYQKSKKYMPGPGQYETAKSTLEGKQKGVGFGPERKISLGIDPKTPGPGQYSQSGYYNGSVANQPNFAFGKSNRSASMTVIGPGPAGYSSRSIFEDSTAKQKGFRLGARLKSKQDAPSNNPGPGAYNADSIKLKTSLPSFSLSKNGKLKLQNQKQFLSKPGVYQYDPKVTAFQHKSFAIGKDKRKGFQTLNNIPGPGNYDLNTKTTQPQFSISKGQRTIIERKNMPGPGDYSPKISSPQNVGTIMGKDERRTFKIVNNVPGPGNYTYEQKKTGGYSIGHEKRSQQKRQDRPGPGNYNSVSTLGNIPSYARTQK